MYVLCKVNSIWHKIAIAKIFTALFEKFIRRGGKNLSQNYYSVKKTKGPKAEEEQHSVISDIFDGALWSSVQCKTCNSVWHTKETFQVTTVLFCYFSVISKLFQI